MKTTQKFVLGVVPMLVLTALAQAETLDEIRVIGDKEGVKNKTNVVTLQDINRSTATDLRGALQEEPAINFGGGNGTSQWLTIRGLGQDQIDLKVDNGYSDTMLFHHQGRFMLDPSLVKVVSVHKGSGAASAGIGATGGSIVARTVDAKDLLQGDKPYGFKLNYGVHSNQGYNKGGAAFAQYDKFDAVFAGNWIKERDYKDGSGRYVQNSALNSRALLAKFGVQVNDDNHLSLSHRQERFYGVRSLREEFDFLLDLDPSNDNKTMPRYRVTTQDTTNLAWQGKNLGFISAVDANVYRTDIKQQDSDDVALLPGTRKMRVQGGNLNLESALSDNYLLKYGVNYRKQDTRPATLSKAKANQAKTDVGVYAEGIWALDPVIITTGLRYDKFDLTTSSGKKVSGHNWNPSLGLIWEANEQLSFNTTLNYATRSPRMYEMALAGRTLVLVDDKVKAERSRNAEVGFNYALSDALSLSGSYFWQTIHDVQGYQDVKKEDRVIGKKLLNSGTLKNHGYEINAAYKWNNLRLRAGVAYSKPKMEGKVADQVSTAVPTGRTWTTGVAYQFNHPSIELGWRGRFVEKAPNSITNNRGGGLQTNERAGYGVNDFYINWQPTGKDNLNVNVALNNAFNKNYRSHSQRAGQATLPGAGRDVRFNINYTF
ncbi:TonB-dependent receptor [Pasteurellaceae bacterium TAE3-ERU1]|nr:TonB-dependent receptor [Pasteurellaceae bacterium TAE3-ERU1]